MGNINKTVKSKYPPKQKNVNWIDTSGNKPIIKVFNNGRWQKLSGGGAGSSNPTEADVNKVWQVTPVLKETKTETRWIIPECTMSQGTIYNADTEYFTEDATVIVNFDGVECECSISSDDDYYYVANEAPKFRFERDFYAEDGFIDFRTSKEDHSEHTISMKCERETPIYDYNWAPGVKIPIPTAEDEGKILVVTETEGNTFTIVPEQSVPINININEATPLTGVDLTKFVVGNTVKVTITPEENDDDGNDDTPVPGHLPDYSGPVEESEQGGSPGTSIPIHKPTISQTVTVTGVIEEHEGVVGVPFDNTVYNFIVVQRDNSLYTDAVIVFGPDATIKLEYIEPNYEYQLQENSDGSGTTSGIPSISKNNQPNIVWREPTEEDLAKLPQDSYYQVADLPEKGNLPLFLAYLDEDDGKMYFEVLYSVRRLLEGGFEVAYNEMTNEIRYKMDDEWSILAAQ